MKTLCIVPCGKKKIWEKNKKAGPTPARDVYIGAFAKICRDYAEIFFPKDYCILSAKYGFLRPDETIPGPYNVSFNDKSTKPITEDKLAEQVKEINLHRHKKIVVLGGKAYTEMVENAFPQSEVTNLFKGCKGNGYMMQRAKYLIARNDSGVK